MYIDHINISAPPDLLEQVRDFYCHILGLTKGFRPYFASGGFWLYSRDQAIIHLAESPEREGNEKQGFFDHFALRVTDLSPIIGRLDKFGVDYHRVHLQDIGLSQLFFKDPSGTGVEVNCLDKPM